MSDEKTSNIPPADEKSKFVLKIDPKTDPDGNPIVGNEGPMVSSDSTWKQRLLQGQDDDE